MTAPVVIELPPPPLRDPISIPEFWVVCIPFGFSYVHMSRESAEQHRKEICEPDPECFGIACCRHGETSLVRYTIAEVVR